MNPNTGEIREFASKEQATAEGFTVQIESLILKQRLEAMTAEERIAWASDAKVPGYSGNRASRRAAAREAMARLRRERGSP